MGSLPPLPPPVKAATDVTVVSATLMGYFQAIPWPSIAAALASLYTFLCIVQLVARWRKRK